MFSLIYGLLFHFHGILKSKNFNFGLLTLTVCAFHALFKKSLPSPELLNSSMYSFRSFVMSIFTFKTRICIQIKLDNFCIYWDKDWGLFFFLMTIQFFQNHLLKRLSLPHCIEYLGIFVKKYFGHRCRELFLELLCSVLLIFLSLFIPHYSLL